MPEDRPHIQDQDRLVTAYNWVSCTYSFTICDRQTMKTSRDCMITVGLRLFNAESFLEEALD